MFQHDTLVPEIVDRPRFEFKMAEYRRVGTVSTGFESVPTQMAQPLPPSTKPNVPSRPVPIKTNSVPSKDQNNKPPNAFFKKLTITSKKSSRSHQENRHKPEVNNRKTTSFYKFNEPKPSVQAHSRPTIIRSQYKKKAPPPRPPPPKLNGASTNITVRCPSYDEVVQADLDAFIGEMNTPRNVPDIPVRPRPPIPSSARGVSLPSLPPPMPQNRQNHRPLSRLYPLQDQSEPALIDFDSSPVPLPKHFAPAVSQQESRSLIDLDTIFSCNDELMPDISSHTQLSNTSQTFSTTQSNYKIPEPNKSAGTSILPGPSKGEDWLQSCLRNTVNGNVPESDYFHDSSRFDRSNIISRSPSSPTPALPPRPINANGVASSSFPFTDNNYSIQSPSSPPPVPPLPSIFHSVPSFAASEFDAPPLPPRPKQFETTPHAIALYDYTAMQSDELSFKANELITLVHYVSGEWMLGFTDSQEGIFPTSFVKVMVPLPANAEKTATTMGPCCEALYDFVGENDSELTFSAGDIIALESRENNEWYKGTFNGRRGTFPTTYVQVLKDLPASGRNINGSALPTATNNKYIALYDFSGETGELSFHEGDLIIVTGMVSAEWMQGRLEQGIEEGRFPTTFVQQVYN